MYGLDTGWIELPVLDMISELVKRLCSAAECPWSPLPPRPQRHQPPQPQPPSRSPPHPSPSKTLVRISFSPMRWDSVHSAPVRSAAEEMAVCFYSSIHALRRYTTEQVRIFIDSLPKPRQTKSREGLRAICNCSRKAIHGWGMSFLLTCRQQESEIDKK
jgi:hypothetical protein